MKQLSMKQLVCMAVGAGLAVFLAAPADAQSSKAAWRFKELVSLSASAGRVPLAVEIRRAPFRSSGRRPTVARV